MQTHNLGKNRGFFFSLLLFIYYYFFFFFWRLFFSLYFQLDRTDRMDRFYIR